MLQWLMVDGDKVSHDVGKLGRSWPAMTRCRAKNPAASARVPRDELTQQSQSLGTTHAGAQGL